MGFGPKYVADTDYIVFQGRTQAGATGSYVAGFETPDTTAALHKWTVPFAGTVISMYATSLVANGAGDTQTLTLYKNEVVTTSSIVTANNDPAGTGYSDTTHTFTVAAGDRLALKKDFTGAVGGHSVTVVIKRTV